MGSGETVRHTFRQRGSVLLGSVCMVACIGMLALSLTEPNLFFWGFLLIGITGPYVLLIRPSLQVSEAGVHINNPVRRTTIPWHLVEECLARWNLQVYAGEQLVTSWAISSQIQRNRPSGLRAFGLYSNPAFDEAKTPAPRGVSAPGMARLLTEARQEWDQAVADGTLVPDGPGAIERAWQPLDIVLLALPVVLVMAGFVVG